MNYGFGGSFVIVIFHHDEVMVCNQLHFHKMPEKKKRWSFKPIFLTETRMQYPEREALTRKLIEIDIERHKKGAINIKAFFRTKKPFHKKPEYSPGRFSHRAGWRRFYNANNLSLPSRQRKISLSLKKTNATRSKHNSCDNFASCSGERFFRVLSALRYFHCLPYLPL